MRRAAASKLKKWGIGAGFTLAAVLILQHTQNNEAFASTVQSKTATGGTDRDSNASSDPVVKEWQQSTGENQGTESDRPFRIGGRHHFRSDFDSNGGGSTSNGSGSDSFGTQPAPGDTYSRPTMRSRHS